MRPVVLHLLLSVALLASSVACCCTAALRSGKTGQPPACCCCQHEPQPPAAPRPAPKTNCSCKQKQPYVPTAATGAPGVCHAFADLLPAVDAWMHTDLGNETLGPRGDFSHFHRTCPTTQERLRALPILRL